MHESESEVVSNSSRPHGLQPTRLLRPWDFPGKSTGVGWETGTGWSYLVRQSPRLFTRTIMKEVPFLPPITKLEDVGREKPFCQFISKACLETHTPRKVEWRQKLFCFCYSPHFWIQSHMHTEYHWHCGNICQQVPHNPYFAYFYLSQWVGVLFPYSWKDLSTNIKQQRLQLESGKNLQLHLLCYFYPFK